MQEENEYLKDLKIDTDNLDVEWALQSQLFAKWASLEADAKRELAQAQEDLKVVRSELITEVAWDKDYSNATKIEAYYRTHERHIEAKKKVIKAQDRANKLSVAVFAFHQRKTTLENLVRLGLADYFARPAVSRDLTQELRKAEERRSERAQNKAKERMENQTRRRRSN